jgi:hypothetical protein
MIDLKALKINNNLTLILCLGYRPEYKRCGVCNIFLACEPIAGKRIVEITGRKTKQDWACFLEQIADQYENAEKITLVVDNLNTHGPGSLYETFQPDKAKAIWDQFEFVYTPKHGSWLNPDFAVVVVARRRKPDTF